MSGSSSGDLPGLPAILPGLRRRRRSGDLAGIERRLDHIAALGADALWLSPVYPSPGVDMGYDVADFRDVDPLFGDLAALDRLIGAAHGRGLRVLMDLVPCHTSIEHPWFAEHPDFYIWADGDAPAQQLGGRVRRPGLDPATRAAAGAGTCTPSTPSSPTWTGATRRWWRRCRTWSRFWLDRGVDGFRLDAIDRLLKDPELRDEPPAGEPFALPLPEEYGRLDTSTPPTPRHGRRLAALRAAAGDALLVGEVFLPAGRRRPYLEHLDAAFAFELLLRAVGGRRAARGDRGQRGRTARPGCCPTTISRACPRAWGRRTRARPRCCC